MDVKRTAECSHRVQQGHESLNNDRGHLVPSHEQGVLYNCASAQGRYLFPVYRMPPVYSQFQQPPIYPLSNAMPVMDNYSGTHNMVGGTKWYELLQSVMKDPSGTR
ncbi:hypothetical protein E2542_SST24392 [Spatholobus suberectus]|nr:hypothetical protein E2542_SST24392 [Spatholobus suberectus]